MGAASFTSTPGSTTLPSDVIPAMVVETLVGNPAATVDLSLGGFRACGVIAPLLFLLPAMDAGVRAAEAVAIACPRAAIHVMEDVMDATVR